MVGGITESLLCWIQTLFPRHGGASGTDQHRDEDSVNIRENQGFTLESRETECLVISASGGLQREGIGFAGGS